MTVKDNEDGEEEEEEEDGELGKGSQQECHQKTGPSTFSSAHLATR